LGGACGEADAVAPEQVPERLAGLLDHAGQAVVGDPGVAPLPGAGQRHVACEPDGHQSARRDRGRGQALAPIAGPVQQHGGAARDSPRARAQRPSSITVIAMATTVTTAPAVRGESYSTASSAATTG